MMQVFRLWGAPDSVIGFNELPERLVEGLEMIRADGFPRHWKEFLGKRKRYIQIPPEKDLLTGNVRRFAPIEEEDSYFFGIDGMIQPQVEKWQEICDYVRQHVPKDFRLLERIEDMAKPLAPDKLQGISLEPEDVPVIPLPKEETNSVVPQIKQAPAAKNIIHCDQCNYEAEGSYAKNSVRMHKQKRHPQPVETKPVEVKV